MKSKGMASTFGVIRKSIQAIGSITKCMALVTSYGRMASNMSESSRRINDMEKENSSGRMVESTREDGSAVSRAEWGITRTMLGFARKGCGLMGNAKSG